MISLNLFNLTLFALTIISLLSAYFYRIIWNKYFNNTKVPQGYGLLLIYYLTLISPIFNFDNNIIYTLLILLIFSSYYWLDDFNSLSAKTRIFIQISCGILIYLVNFYQFQQDFSMLILSCFIFGFINFLLTNITNFYDGLDLNLSTFIIINSIIAIYIFSNNDQILIIFSIIIIFVLTFAIFNTKKNNLFFGDSGCFIFSSLLTFLFIIGYYENNDKLPYIFIGLSLPIVDVMFVIIYRLLKKESLLTRNYYHLYQKYGLFIKNKSYILLQIINSITIISLLNIINNFNQLNSILTILVIFISTCIFYTISSLYINEISK